MAACEILKLNLVAMVVQSKFKASSSGNLIFTLQQ